MGQFVNNPVESTPHKSRRKDQCFVDKLPRKMTLFKIKSGGDLELRAGDIAKCAFSVPDDRVKRDQRGGITMRAPG